MRIIGISGCALAIAFVAPCGPIDPPQAHRTRRNQNAGGSSGTSSGAGRSGLGITPPGGGRSARSKGEPPPGGGGPGADFGTFSEAVEEADPAPLPIAGGTLAIVARGTRAAVADPDHDQVVVVELESMTVAAATTTRTAFTWPAPVASSLPTRRRTESSSPSSAPISSPIWRRCNG